ncbi:MAG: radical SAM protein [Atopobiaceae bacterium]|nr:radical SAM protein [Atopobiaceae bacterium]
MPDSDRLIVANLFRGTATELTPLFQKLLSSFEEFDEDHPAIKLFSSLGYICNFDERAVLESMGRMACGSTDTVGFIICPTLGCNFDCPYCFEDHFAGFMSQEVQDDVVALAERMLGASNARTFQVNWYGGEPLLAPDIIESLSMRLIELAESHGATYESGIITNGHLLTQDIADMLGRARVDEAQITLDGIGASHDATRHLVGGGATFERIVDNLRSLKLPFRVNVRHNMHEDNYQDEGELKELLRQIATESGNELNYNPAVVFQNEVFNTRSNHMHLLQGSLVTKTQTEHEAERFGVGRGYFCGANSLWTVGIDHLGNLQKCWEAVDKPRYSFGTAHDWDPTDPLRTAAHPDQLTCYLNTTGPVPDKECHECVWLPVCVGDCPHKRLFDGGRTCISCRNDPESFVLALYEQGRTKGPKNGQGQ